MAEIFVENRVCPACGAEVRKGALFCFSCGGSVAPETAAANANGDSVKSDFIRENIVEEEVKIKENKKSKKTHKLDKTVAEQFGKPIEKPTDKLIEKPVGLPIEKPFELPIEKPIAAAAEPKLKSAAAMRRRTKTIQKKRVEEVVWAEHENAPNGWFMIVALILILIAAGLFFLAIYIK